jgi:hypothetical protein
MKKLKQPYGLLFIVAIFVSIFSPGCIIDSNPSGNYQIVSARLGDKITYTMSPLPNWLDEFEMIITTTGYENFSDGLDVMHKCLRVDNNVVFESKDGASAFHNVYWIDLTSRDKIARQRIPVEGSTSIVPDLTNFMTIGYSNFEEDFWEPLIGTAYLQSKEIKADSKFIINSCNGDWISYSVTGQENISNKNCYVLDATTNLSNVHYKYWICLGFPYPLKVQMIENDEYDSPAPWAESPIVMVDYIAGNETIQWNSCNSKHYETMNKNSEYLEWADAPQDGKNCELKYTLSEAIEDANTALGLKSYRDVHEGEYVIYAKYTESIQTFIENYTWNITYGTESGECYFVIPRKTIFVGGIPMKLITDEGAFNCAGILPRNSLSKTCLSIEGAIEIAKECTKNQFVSFEWSRFFPPKMPQVVGTSMELTYLLDTNGGDLEDAYISAVNGQIISKGEVIKTGQISS